MAVKIEDTRLWNVQEDQLNTKVNAQADVVYGQDSEDALITALEKETTIDLTGTVSAIRLSRQAGYSDDPETALAEWLVELEQYVNGEQGGGWNLVDDERGKDINVFGSSIGWGKSQGERYQATYDIELEWGQSISTSTSTTGASVSPTSTWELVDSEQSLTVDLDSIRDYRMQRQQEIDQYAIAYADAGENLAMQQSGVVRRITISGTKADTASALDTFDDNIESMSGLDKTVDYTEAYTGRTFEVAVDDYRSTRESGRPRSMDYELTLVEGFTYGN